jgi:hypothetical protein
MNRSPLFYPLNRGMDAEGGGAAELQTDVMRFMAIISMCLVAIFALVQSIPLAPQTPAMVVEERPVPESTAEPEATPEPVTETVEQAVTLTRPKPVTPRPREYPVPLQRPAQQAAQARQPVIETPEPQSEPVPKPDTATPNTTERNGFTLRFESDAVLTRLVESDAISLYVIASNETRRLQVGTGRVSFWSSSTPEQFHEMDPDTVPAAFVTTWQRQHGNSTAAPQWAVALPPAMSRQVRDHLASGDGGSLVIGANEQVRLER